MATRMTTYKIRYYLLGKPFPMADIIEYLLELMKQAKRWFAHNLQDIIGSMFRCHLQSSAYMMDNQLACVISGCTVQRFILLVVQQKVVSYATANKAFLYIGHSIHFSVYFKKRTVITIQVGTYLRMNTRRTYTYCACFQVFTMHHIHIGTGTT